MLESSLYFVQFCSGFFFVCLFVCFCFLCKMVRGVLGVGGCFLLQVGEGKCFLVSTDLNVLDLHVLFCFCFIDARMLFEQ